MISYTSQSIFKRHKRGQPWWRSGLVLPAAQGMILETLDRVSCRAPCMEPPFPSACVSASLSVSDSMNKQIKS